MLSIYNTLENANSNPHFLPHQSALIPVNWLKKISQINKSVMTKASTIGGDLQPLSGSYCALLCLGH